MLLVPSTMLGKERHSPQSKSPSSLKLIYFIHR
jgi:hypothetical protein